MKISLSSITDRIVVREVKPEGVAILKKKIEEVGYLPEKPVLLAPNGTGETYTLIDGNYRTTALAELGIDFVEAEIDESLVTRESQLRRARLANEITEVVVPTTFVDDAQLVWDLAAEGLNQTEIGNIMGGWSRSKVADYAALNKINKDAWKIIVATFSISATGLKTDAATDSVAIATIFTEGLLRNILPLTDAQQLQLVEALSTGAINKKKFTEQSKVYKTRNEIAAYVLDKLTGLDNTYLEKAEDEVYSGAYDRDWSTPNKTKIEKLIQSLIDEHEEKTGSRIYIGDFEELSADIESESIDLILTDPPYNISDNSRVTKKGNKIVNSNFDGEDDWDTVDQTEYIAHLNLWVDLWTDLIRPGGSIIVFCDRPLIGHLWDRFITKELLPKNIITWVKTNPNPSSLSRRNLVSATEFMIWVVKPGSEYTFNESASWDRRNVIETGLCAGLERVKDSNGDTLHATQKPLALLNPLVEVFSNRGDLILDGFAGVGSTGVAAKTQGRKFIGIEKSETYYRAILDRLGG